MPAGKLKVLAIAPYTIFPARAGGQRFTVLFFEHIATLCDLICVTVQSNDPGYAKGYRVFNVLSNSPLRYINIFYFFRLRKIIRQEKINSVMLEHPYYGWLGLLLKWFCGVQLIIHSQNIESTRWKSLGKWWWPILSWYEGMTHRCANHNLFITDEDRIYAIQKFRLKEATCITSTYGIERDAPPPPEEKRRCRQLLFEQYKWQPGTLLLLFNGALNYIPNLQAVTFILEHINPLLLQQNIPYKLIICGKGLPDSFNDLKEYENKNIVYTGFVDDISLYFKGVHVFLNPVQEGGGIKTKLVEALGFNTPAVSVASGAIGVTTQDAGQLLSIVANNDWKEFVQESIRLGGTTASVPRSFYTKFYWGNIARTAIAFISS